MKPIFVRVQFFALALNLCSALSTGFVTASRVAGGKLASFALQGHARPGIGPLRHRTRLVAAALSILLIAPTSWAGSDLPRNGLIMHLESTAGVQARAGVIKYWRDQSGHGQDLQSIGEIKRIENVLNGRPVIELDAKDEMLRQFRPTSLPTHGNDRTLFVLSAPSNVGAVLGYGKGKCGSFFMLRHAVEGYSGVSTGCSKFTMNAQQELTPGRWRLNTVVLSSGTLHHLLDGDLVDGRTLRLGTSTGNGPFRIKLKDIETNADERRGGTKNLRIATVLVYDRALGPKEMLRVHSYLETNYFGDLKRFGFPPDLRTVKMPAPKIRLTKTVLANERLLLDWRVSFADTCKADNGWTSSRATTGSHQLDNIYEEESYTMDCWRSDASTSAEFKIDLQPVRLRWRPSNNQEAIIGYRLHIGDSSKSYNKTINIPKNDNPSHTLHLSPGIYHIAMSALANQGRESRMSGELSIKVE